MKILQGKYEGKTGVPHQWANDWITADVDGKAIVLTPPRVQLNADEIVRFRATEGYASVGLFWAAWLLNDDGTFTARLPRPSRPVRRSSEEVRRRRT